MSFGIHKKSEKVPEDTEKEWKIVVRILAVCILVLLGVVILSILSNIITLNIMKGTI